MAAEHQIGIAFIVAKQNIVFGRQGFDEVVFQNQRLGFRAGNRGFHPRHLFDHQHNARRMIIFLEITADTALQVHRFTHIQNLPAVIEHAINTGQVRQVFQKYR